MKHTRAGILLATLLTPLLFGCPEEKDFLALLETVLAQAERDAGLNSDAGAETGDESTAGENQSGNGLEVAAAAVAKPKKNLFVAADPNSVGSSGASADDVELGPPPYESFAFEDDPADTGAVESSADEVDQTVAGALLMPAALESEPLGAVSEFDTDGHAQQEFDACFSAEGRVGSSTKQKGGKHELLMEAPHGGKKQKKKKKGSDDFEWRNGGLYDFAFVLEAGRAVFEVGDVRFEGAYYCGPINAVQIRCRANKGEVQLSSISLNDEDLSFTVEAASDGGNELSIVQINGAFTEGLVLTGVVRMSWDDKHPPKNSQLSFRLTAGAVEHKPHGPPSDDESDDDAPDPEPDCNTDGVSDQTEIASGESADCNANGVPDLCDIADGTSADVNENGVPDECEQDCNANRIPDSMEIELAYVSDCDADGVPDDCQPDSDGDGLIDACDNCPDDPSKIHSGICGCGSPDVDLDGDGVVDCDDQCVDTPDGAEVDTAGCELLTAEAGGDVSLEQVGPLQLQAQVNGGIAPYSYQWSGSDGFESNQQNPIVLPGQTTTYTLTVTDGSAPPNMVTDSVTVTIIPPDGLQYTIENLGSLSSKNSFAQGLNDSGQVVGYYVNAEGRRRAFLYSDGTMIDLGTVGGLHSSARDVNEAGQVVGDAMDANGHWHAFIWDSAGGMHDLGTLGGSISQAYAINESGQVVGSSDDGAGFRAFVYSEGVMQALPTFDFARSGAFGINDLSQSVGTIIGFDGRSRAFVVDAGELIALGSPLLSESQAWKINSSGMLIGSSWGAGEFRSFLYSSGLSLDLGELADFPQTFAFGINDAGQLVGSSRNTVTRVSHAFVFSGGQLLDLNNLLIPGHGWDELTGAFAVNSRGQIAGYGRIDGVIRAFRLTPAP